MIQRLCDIHVGRRVAVVGSGPTASLYHGDCDISIGINGAALLPHRFDYFLCGDQRSPTMNWFHVDCSDVRIIADLVATCDKRLYPPEQFPTINRVAAYQHNKGILGPTPDPVEPHVVFRFERFEISKLTKVADYLMYGGTISCGALQLAWIMGAAIVDIYGCPFTHKDGSYFYHCNQPGAVSRSQLQTMQTVVSTLRQEIVINVVGESLLK